ncbi:MAG TPA: phytanoyl-CoA dioxygenase family protein [Jatrophihabitantaceae bacterium]|nr:phytanoyl-CoA dioxygenase family protein [Jatrophihabitantaceae bacterium]
MSLTADDVDRFLVEGFVRLDGAVDAETARECRDELWAATGYARDDRRTWTKTLVRIDAMGTPPFRAAANAPALLTAFDQLVGPGRWVPRTGLGTFPLRFPGGGEAREAGWHVEASFEGPDGGLRVNLHSRGRALLMLFLFSDVGEDDAPTLIRVGSHLDVAPLLAPFGEDGLDWMTLCQRENQSSASRPVTAATGSIGDVYLCHPFLVHSGQAHRGTEPRFMAQPPLVPVGSLNLDSNKQYPVGRAIRSALGS